MKVVAGETELLEFECSGRRVTAWGNDIGIDDAGRVSSGGEYGVVLVNAKHEDANDALTLDERHELALHMVRRWLAFAHVPDYAALMPGEASG